MRNIYVLRHGQTDFNIEGRLQGGLDTPLNATGIQQAKDVITSLLPLNIDSIYSSPLTRALDTSKIINTELNAPNGIICADFLKEITRGAYDGLLSSEVEAIHPKVLSNAFEDFFERPPQGESLGDVYLRVATALPSVLKNPHWNNLLMVTHGITIRAINLFFSSQGSLSVPDDLNPFFDLKIGNCSLFTYTIED